MPAVGGPIESISLNSRSFAVTADSDANVNLGGFNNEKQANGDGTARTIKTRVPWSVTGIGVEIDDSRGDHEFIQDLADGNEDFPVALVYTSGSIYQGVGQIIGEPSKSTSGASLSLDLSGGGKLSAQ